MSKEECWNRCWVCGKFISLNDFIEDKATCTVKDYWSVEQEDMLQDIRNFCKRCSTKENKNGEKNV